MEISKVIPEQLDQLFRLISMYKSEIGEENILCNEDKEAITKAINENRIIF
ncbi:hypothetical protein [Treponema pedis]|uniref:hypothetical protein n=1 Tax=Treponema pedis TaxID=409322 RepID=UPI00040C01C9|nr:hypothetical protein [Treponema pedis]